MYSINETILYGTNGLCRIVDITTRLTQDKEIEYYVLKPINDENSSIYVPVENSELVCRMRKTVNADEIRRILKSVSNEQEPWVVDIKQRQEKYKDIVRNGDIEGLILFLRALYLHQKQQVQKGRKLHITDERIFKEAQKLLHDQISLAMNISQEQVVQLLIDELEQPEENLPQ